jgi:hypothetical protein
MRRRSLLVLLLLLFVPAAGAWTWPVQGPVLQTFSFDPASPYAAGQHRGIAIGAGDGAPVLAPASGVVSFAGTVPTNGKTITIQTPSGLAVSLTHLGSIGVARDASVEEGAPVGTVGSSGTPEFDVPYVHLGIREAANDQGYLDPLAFLPVLAPPAAGPPPDPAPAPAQAPTPAQPGAGSAPATGLAAPQPVEAPAAPAAAPVVPAAPTLEEPAAPVVPAPPVVEVPAPSPSAPLEPSLPQMTVTAAPVAPGIRSPQASAVASPESVHRAGPARPTALALPTLAWLPLPAAQRSVAVRLPSDPLALQALRVPDVRPRPLPAARPQSTPGTVTLSHGFVRPLLLGLVALLLVAALAARFWGRRPRPPAPLLRLHAVHSTVRGWLAA